MDFVIEALSINEETGEFEATLRPNPERYEWREKEGERVLYDKLDNTVIPESVLAEGIRLAEGVPIYYQPPLITSSREYISSRIPHIASMLDGEMPDATVEDKSGEFLDSLGADKLGFSIISLDIVGSTQLAATTDSKAYAHLIAVLLFEISEVIPKFHGHVLKYTGDGIIAYFPEPSFITKNDLAIDCALTLRALVYQAIIPLLEDRALPSFAVRIGMDSGEAYVVALGSPETKRHRDLIGMVISIAAKIEEQAEPAEILLGAAMEHNLHTSWRKVCEAATLGDEWNYAGRGGEPYRVYRVVVD